MPSSLTYPGVYVEEVPSGVRTIAGVSTAVTAFVGYTTRGPANRAVRIFNFGDFERQFGGLHRDSELSYAVQQFFLNGGAEAQVVRVAKGVAAAAVTLKFGGGGGDAALVVSAANEGAWGNAVRLDVDYDTSNPDSTFNLVATRYERQAGGDLVPVESEVFRNLSMSARASTYAVDVVKAGSNLIRVKRPDALAFADRGFSLSGALQPFPALTAQQNTVNGVLDGADPFTLTLADPAAITSVASLGTALTAAINAAGLASRLGVARANALGADDLAGNHIKLTSLLVAGNPATANEFSSVRIVSAPANDASVALRLGLGNQGREKDGSSFRRPQPTGTTGADLASAMGTSVSGAVQVTITDQTPGASGPILATTNLTLPATVVGPALRDQLQTLLRGLTNPAAQQAVVQLVGTRLRVLPGARTPNAAITFAGAGASASGLAGAGSFVNVLQYALGLGPDFGAQAAAALGSDGAPPGAAELIGSYGSKTGIYALRDVEIFNLLSIPRIGTGDLNEDEANSVISAAVGFCEQSRAFFLMDPLPTKDLTNIKEWAASASTSRNAAVFFPRIEVADPLNQFRPRPMPPSGAVAGVFARTDSQRGVWKAPAGTEATLLGISRLAVTLTDPENGTLNQKGVNCLRSFPGFGQVIWGARTTRGADNLTDEYKYVPVRRLALFLEESLFRGLKWVVFEPNDEPLWAQIRLNVGAFMQGLFRQGAFQGQSPREAYFVKCDKETTTQNDINLGVVNILVGFAPLKPAEFVVLKLQQMAGQIAT